MSADNWRICPKCKKNDEADQEKQRAELKKAYGKVSEEKYLEMKSRIESAQPIDVEHLREDFEVGMEIDGIFFVTYKCFCDVCGFSHAFDTKKKVKI